MSKEITNPVQPEAEGVNARVKYPVRKVLKLKRSGVEVSIPEDWHMQDTMASQRFGKGDANRVQLGLIQRTCLFNGERWNHSQIEERITGRDWLMLQGEFFGDDDDEEDEEKNG